ncbi:MAG: DUF3343 domain-containing protein [Lachnospirales bacterium]
MDIEVYYIATFDSTHKAIESEKLSENLFNSRLIPIPVEISAGCGLSLKADDYSLFIEKKLPYSKIYKIVKKDFEKEIEEIVLK